MTDSQPRKPRELDDWLLSYLEYTEEQESPEQLHFWTGLTVLSASLRRQVYMLRGPYTLYPNIYVVIVGESAKIRKSVAMGMGVYLLTQAVPDIVTSVGKITPEGLIKHMNRIVNNGGNPSHESHTLILADELATLFGYDKLTASRMAILLTEIYDSRAEYRHTTKSDGVTIVKNLYPTLLAGTDPRNLKVLPEEAVGGLLGRTIFVTANARRKKIAWPQVRPEGPLYTSLLVDLARISSLVGVMEPTPEAVKYFSDWYEYFSDVDVPDPRLDAFMERAPDTALKISMLVSVSRTSSLSVTREHVEAGVKIVEKQIDEFSRSMDWAGNSPYSQHRAKFIDILRRVKGVSTKQYLSKAMSLPKEDLNSLLASLKEEGIVEVEAVGKEIIVKFTPEALQRFQREK